MDDSRPANNGEALTLLADKPSITADRATDTGQTTLSVGNPQQEMLDVPAADTSHAGLSSPANGKFQHPEHSNGPSKQPGLAPAAQAPANGNMHSTGSAAATPAGDLSSKQAVKAAVNSSPFAGIAASDAQQGAADPAAATDSATAVDAIKQQQQLHASANSSSPMKQQGKEPDSSNQQQRPGRLRIGGKRVQEDRSLFSPSGASPPTVAAGAAGLDNRPAAVDSADTAAAVQGQEVVGGLANKRRKQSPTAAAAQVDQQQQRQQGGMHRQHSADHSHIRKHHEEDEQLDFSGDEPAAAEAEAAQAADDANAGQQQQQRRREGSHLRRALKKVRACSRARSNHGIGYFMVTMAYRCMSWVTVGLLNRHILLCKFSARKPWSV